jgi:hypothetical protein
MQKMDETTFAELNDHHFATLLRECHKARYAELMSPEDVAEVVAEEGTDQPAEGWLVFTELERQDIERLTSERLRSLNLTVRSFDDGLPVVVLSVLAQAVRYVWVVPMWEDDAQVWLRDAVDRGRIALAVNAVDAPLSVVLTTGQDVLPHADKLLAAAKVDRQPEGLAHLFHMFSVGMEMLGEESGLQSGGHSTALDNRLMMVGRGENAGHLIGMFAASAELLSARHPSVRQTLQ